MPPWKEKRRKAALIISLMCVEVKKVTEIEEVIKAEWAGGVESRAQECWHTTNKDQSSTGAETSLMHG